MIVDYSDVELTPDNNKTIEHITQFNLLGVWPNNNPSLYIVQN